jgi:1,4-dihydroxy-2-naphthoyl-CoA hydrolase
MDRPMTPKKKSARKRVAAPLTRAARVFTGGIPRTLGMRAVSMSRKRVVVEMPVGKVHRNPNGHVNGGAIMSLADVTGAVGAVANLPPNYRTGTLESKTNFFAPATGPLLRAVAVPLHIGRTTSVWQTTITNGKGGKRVAIVTQTQIHLPHLAP